MSLIQKENQATLLQCPILTEATLLSTRTKHTLLLFDVKLPLCWAQKSIREMKFLKVHTFHNLPESIVLFLCKTQVVHLPFDINTGARQLLSYVLVS